MRIRVERNGNIDTVFSYRKSAPVFWVTLLPKDYAEIRLNTEDHGTETVAAAFDEYAKWRKAAAPHFRSRIRPR